MCSGEASETILDAFSSLCEIEMGDLSQEISHRGRRATAGLLHSYLNNILLGGECAANEPCKVDLTILT